MKGGKNMKSCSIAMSGLIVALAQVAALLIGAAGFTRWPHRLASVAAQSENRLDSAARIFREGRELIADEQWEKAAAKFNEVITRYSDSPNIDAALYWLALALKKQGKFQQSDQALAQLIERFPDSAWARDARAMRIEIAPRLGKGDLIAEGATAAEDEIKIIALGSLFRANPERAAALAIDLLKPDSTASLRLKQAAISLLGQYGGKLSTPLLIDVARGQLHPELRKTAIYWLGRMEDQTALSFLKEVATKPDEGDLARAALFAIAQHSSPQARELLIELARTASSREVRKQAIFWLGQRRDQAAVSDLMKIYEADTDVELRKQILFALSQIGSQQVQEKLIEIARAAENLEIRRQVIFVLGQQGSPQAIDALVALYDAEKSEEIKEELLFAFSRSGKKSALKKLMEVARGDPSPALRKKAIFWLGQSRDPEVLKFLEELIK
jgi:HEAT repeat protein